MEPLQDGIHDSSLSARTRLVGVSQALEVESLQKLIKTRERDAAVALEHTKQLLTESRRQVDVLNERNKQLQQQAALLGDKLQSMEEQRRAQDASTLKSYLESSTLQDTAMNEMREELRGHRHQIASLLEEREVLLEKLVVERSRSTMMSIRLQDQQHRPQDGPTHAGRRDFHASSEGHIRSDADLVDVAVQTTDLGSLTLEEGETTTDDLRQRIAELQRHLALEMEHQKHHEGRAQSHASNAAVVQQHLQRCVQLQLERLKAEQDAYRLLMAPPTLMTSHHPAAYHSQLTVQAPPTTDFMTSNTQLLPATPQRPWPVSSAPDGIVSSSDIAGATVTATEAAATSPFLAQQEKEMLHLRRRLQDLQARHQGQNDSKTLQSVHSAAGGGGGSGSGGAASGSSQVVQSSALLRRMLESANRYQR